LHPVGRGPDAGYTQLHRRLCRHGLPGHGRQRTACGLRLVFLSRARLPDRSFRAALKHRNLRRKAGTARNGVTEKMLKIVSAKVIVTCPGRNFVTLKIETSDGVTGLGDATLNGRELAVASYLNDHLIPCLIGRDAHAIEDTWQYFYRGA